MVSCGPLPVLPFLTVPDDVYAPALAFACACATVGLLSRGRFARIALDRPNERSLHKQPVPRSGGVGLMGAVLLAWFVAVPSIPWMLPALVVLLMAVSFYDDLRDLNAGVRLIAHLLCSLALVGWAAGETLPLWTWPLLTLAIGWMINLYNFMDGSDGLAGGMAFFGFSAYGMGAALAGHGTLATASWVVAAAALGFLCFNFHPARIFMGDAGSVPLGFLAGALGLTGWLQDTWPWWFAPCVFAPFIADATVTLLRRLLAGEAVWRAHREHYYQRLIRLGYGHRTTALLAYVLMIICAAAASIALTAGTTTRVGLLALTAAAVALAFMTVDVLWRRRPEGTA